MEQDIQDDINVWNKMKHDLTTGTWQDDTGCPISIILAATSDGAAAVATKTPAATAMAGAQTTTNNKLREYR